MFRRYLRKVVLLITGLSVLQSIYAKSLSRLQRKIVEHLEKHELIKESHRGFKKKSCLTNLLVFLDEITDYLDPGYSVDVIYLDFQKAFDKVPHRRLALKVAAHGIDSKVLRWTENWLHGRKQKVVLGGQVSDWRDILSRVPEGSVLGSLLFNDIDDSLSSKILNCR